MSHHYYILNKPYQMVSQFISPDDVRLLSDLNYDFPAGIHAIGRLDNHSEGLLILTTNKKVTKLLFESKEKHKRTYLVKVKGVINSEQVNQLRSGIPIFIKGSVFYTTEPCEVEVVAKPKNLFDRKEEQLNEIYEKLPHSWLKISMKEGKFHQVRKMVQAAGHKCIRLIRLSIEDLELDDLQPFEIREIEEKQFFKLLRLKEPE